VGQFSVGANIIIKKADESMYRAKDAGGNRCEFYS
jgi:GGDEF domain-containing protein